MNRFHGTNTHGTDCASIAESALATVRGPDTANTRQLMPLGTASEPTA